MDEETKPLPRKQRVFVEAYLQTWNATEAARRAGYAHPDVQGPRLLGKVRVSAAVEKRMDEIAMRTDEILARLSEQARGDLRDFFKIAERWTENPLPSEEILDEEEYETEARGEPVIRTRYLVRKVVLDTDALVDPERSRLVKKYADSPKNGLSIEIHDPQAALVHMGRHRKLFTDVQEHTGAVALVTSDEMARARQKAAALEEELLSDG